MPELITIGEKYIAVTGIPEEEKPVIDVPYYNDPTNYICFPWIMEYGKHQQALPEGNWSILGRLNDLTVPQIMEMTSMCDNRPEVLDQYHGFAKTWLEIYGVTDPNPLILQK